MENIRHINIEIRKYSKLTNLCKKLAYIPFLTIKTEYFFFLLIINLQIAFIDSTIVLWLALLVFCLNLDYSHPILSCQLVISCAILLLNQKAWLLAGFPFPSFAVFISAVSFADRLITDSSSLKTFSFVCQQILCTAFLMAHVSVLKKTGPWSGHWVTWVCFLFSPGLRGTFLCSPLCLSYPPLQWRW